MAMVMAMVVPLQQVQLYTLECEEERVAELRDLGQNEQLGGKATCAMPIRESGLGAHHILEVSCDDVVHQLGHGPQHSVEGEDGQTEVPDAEGVAQPAGCHALHLARLGIGLLGHEVERVRVGLDPKDQEHVDEHDHVDVVLVLVHAGDEEVCVIVLLEVTVRRRGSVGRGEA